METQTFQPAETLRDGRFAEALGYSGVKTRPIQEDAWPAATPRARRFGARLVVWYRLPGSDRWHQGLTENISRTGLLFRTNQETPPLKGASLEMVLEMPSGEPGALPERVEAQAEVQRTEWDLQLPEMLPAVAVTLRWRSPEAASWLE